MKNDYSKKIVNLVIGLNVVFTLAVLLVFWHTGSEPSALVAAFFAFTTGELWMLSKIKRDKIGKDDSND